MWHLEILLSAWISNYIYHNEYGEIYLKTSMMEQLKFESG